MILLLNFDGTLRTNTSSDGKTLPTVPWDDTMSRLLQGAPHKATRLLIRLAAPRGIRIHIMAGWPEAYRDLIKAWLDKYQIPVHRLYLRPDGDDTPLVELKLGWARKLTKGNLWMVMDNDPRVVRRYKQLSLPAFMAVLPQPGNEIF
jgi:hypothetical protein